MDRLRFQPSDSPMGDPDEQVLSDADLDDAKAEARLGS
jgi:hypothetical protein